MVELVEINLVAVLGVLLRPLDTRANEEIVADHFPDHLLVLVSVINILPVSVLGKQNVPNSVSLYWRHLINERLPLQLGERPLRSEYLVDDLSAK